MPAPAAAATAAGAVATSNWMNALCASCTWSGLIYAVIAILALKYLLKPNWRRAPSKPAVDAKRNYVRGSGQIIDCINPATGERLTQCRAYTPDEVKAAYKRAKAAQVEWSKTSFAERRAVMMEISDYVLAHQNEIMMLSCKDTGKTLAEGVLGEIALACEKCRWLCEYGEKLLAPESRPVPSLFFLKKAWVEYRPLGVLGAIVPWNYPCNHVLCHGAAALFAGDGIVFKVSEYASASAEPLEDIFRTILARRGHNPDLLQVVTGYAETGSALIESGVEKILFIGSPAVGKRVMEKASKTLTPVILELGGKDPFIVFDDADFMHTIDIAIRGAFINCGQNCVSSERFYIHAPIYDKFVAEMEKRMKQFRLGSCQRDGGMYDFGAIVMPQQLKIVDSLVTDARAKGARVLSGGKLAPFTAGGDVKAGDDSKAGAKLHNGYFYEPTLLADVTHDMRVANEEAFGPIMTIIKFEDEEHVIKMCNSAIYGLGATVCTLDTTRQKRMASALDCGMVTINDYSVVPTINSLPFGGVKDSGFGCFNGFEGFRGLCNIKSVVADRFPIRTTAPGFLLYPMADNAHLIAQSGMAMIFGSSWLASAKALVSMLGLIAKAKKPAPVS